MDADGGNAFRGAADYCCKSPSGKTITISYNKRRYDNVKSACSCGYTEEEILVTLEEDYPKNTRALRWMETEEHGEVLLHYFTTNSASGTKTLCGIVYNRSTDQYVRKEDFEAKKEAKKKRSNCDRSSFLDCYPSLLPSLLSPP